MSGRGEGENGKTRGTREKIEGIEERIQDVNGSWVVLQLQGPVDLRALEGGSGAVECAGDGVVGGGGGSGGGGGGGGGNGGGVAGGGGRGVERGSQLSKEELLGFQERLLDEVVAEVS